MEKITEADLFDAIEEYVNTIPARQKEPGTIRSGELADEYGVSAGKAQKILKKMVKEGILVKKLVWFVDDWGKRQTTPGYKLTGSDDDTSTAVSQ